jgi:NAD(P)-dependent dehydrogenase (short-subunit alcohol dehydrogenase family)
VVTGAAQGLGLGVARCLADYGASIVLTDVNPEVERNLLEPRFAGSVAVIKDLADADAAEYVMSAAVRRVGPIDALINCAAWSLQKPLGEMTVEEYDRLIAINQRAPFFLCQQFAAQLTEASHDPCIVNIASVNALAGNARLIAYAGTKGALVAMTRALAVELAPRVRVLAISPGSVRTDNTLQLIRAGVIDPNELTSRMLIPHLIEVPEIAELIAFLLQPAAKSLTGCNWVFDGVFTAQ